MTSSRRLDLTEDARADIRSILRFTRRRWGSDQRAIYGRRLETAMERLTTFPELGDEGRGLPEGMRARVVAEHVIYYRFDERAIMVIRVLHAKMDASKQFGN